MDKIAKFSGLGFRVQCLWMLYLLSTLLAKGKFRFYHVINLINMKFKGVTHGKNFSTFGLLILDIYPGSTVKLGDNVAIVSNVKRATASALFSKVKIKTFSSTSEIIIGNRVALSGTSITCRSKKISIGDNVAVAPNVIIMDSDFHIPLPYGDWFAYPGFERDADVIIENQCFIGLNSVVLQGVHIGKNCVIAAGSVVVNDIPDCSLAGGVPAMVLKKIKPPE
jgi:acetyltransferase-like isoleucine patch superfamily enzyme